MALRFRKSIKILPGVSLNLSRSGVSASVGPRGAKVNIGKRGARATVGIPGTGLSVSQKLSSPSSSSIAPAAPAAPGLITYFTGLVAAALAFMLVAMVITGAASLATTAIGGSKNPTLFGIVMMLASFLSLWVGYLAARTVWRRHLAR